MANVTDVEKALLARFALLAYPYVSYPDGPEVIAPAGQTVYEIRSIITHGVAAALMANAAERYEGFLQVNVLSPADGLGNSRALINVEAVMAQFKRGTTCTKNGVVVHCRTPKYVPVDHPNVAWYCIVVTVPWWADVFVA